jgi:hypothetical protein
MDHETAEDATEETEQDGSEIPERPNEERFVSQNFDEEFVFIGQYIDKHGDLRAVFASRDEDHTDVELHVPIWQLGPRIC